MEKLKKSLDAIREIILKKDFDWVHVVTGYEGVGKSTLAMHICNYIDRNFNVDKIVFSADELIKAVKNSSPGDAIMVDEGALIFFSRDSMTKESKKAIRLLTGMRTYNLFIVINIPNFFILDKYIREHRVKTLTRVVMRGWFWFYSPARVKMLKIDDKTKKVNWDIWNYRDSFKKFKGELWNQYIEKKKKLVLENSDMEKKKKKEFTKEEAIRRMILSGKLKLVDIAKAMGVTHQYVSIIKKKMEEELPKNASNNHSIYSNAIVVTKK